MDVTTTEYLSTTTLARINADGAVRVFCNGELVGTFATRSEMRAWWDAEIARVIASVPMRAVR